MSDATRSPNELRAELARLRQRVAELEDEQHQRQRLASDLEVVFHHSPLPMCVVGFEGYLQRVNPALQRAFGYSAEELTAWPYAEFLHPDDHAALEGHLRQLAAGRPLFDVETRICRPSGEVRLLLWSAIPLTRAAAFFCIATDITQRRHDEQELSRHRALLRATIDSLPFNFFAIGLDGRYMLQNIVSKQQHGFDTIGKRPEEICNNAHDLAIWQENNRRAFAGEKVVGDVTLSYAGEERHYHNIVAPIREGQQLYGILGVNIDITERKRAEEELRRTRDELEGRVAERTRELTQANEKLDLFRRFADAAGQGFGMADLEGIVRYFNPAMCCLTGIDTADEALGRPVIDFFPEAYHRLLLEENFPTTLRDGHWVGEVPFLTRQGRLIPAVHHTLLIRDADGQPFRLAVVSTDITERQRAEEALRASEERYRAVVEDQTELISRVTPDGRFLFVNDAFARFFGQTRQQLLQSRWQPLPVPGDLSFVEQELRRMTPQEPIVVIEHRVRSGDGSLRWMQFVNRGIFDGSGALLEIQAVGRDITDRKRAESDRERQHRMLGHLLRASDHERQVIAYDIHDGLAQHLAGALMQLDAYGHLKDFQPAQAAEAFAAGVRMLRQGHFEARRLISGVRPPILDEQGVVAAIDHLIHEQGGRAGPEIALHTRVQFRRLEFVEENAIYRIVQEGLANVAKHSRSRRARVSLTQRENRLRIEIRDWGVGFDPRQSAGNRFGLTGIRERARLLGGRFRIRSAPGAGTTLVVVLPIVERKDEAQGESRSAEG